jgi:TolB-like protein/Tfp pilus assembly protein PilF
MRGSPRRAAAIILAATVALAAGAFIWSRRDTPPATRRIESLAILPLSNFSGDRQNDYFADAMTEELTSQLAAVHSLRVASRTSASAYRNTKKPLSTVARELGVDGVIEGSVIRRGDRARITVQLIDGASDRHVWSESFERDGADIMILQRDIAREIVERVRATLSPAEQEQMARVPTRNNEAYDAYLHATYKQKTAMQSRADADEAIRYAERAVALDPAFAEAWVTLAYACQMQMFHWKGGKEYDEKAFIAVQKALALNPSLAQAYIIRGVLNYNQWHAYDLGATIVDYRRAIALNPNLAYAHQNLGSELTHLGLHDQAIAAFRTALRLDPQDGAATMRLARALWQSNRFEEARDAYERYDIRTFERAVALAYLGRYDDAWKIARNPDSPTYKYDFGAVRAFLHALRGEAQQAEGEITRAASEGAGVAHFHHAACILAAADAELGNADRAVRWLEVAASTGMPNYPLFRDNPSLRKLRGNARYEKFLADLRPRWEQIVSQAR